MNLGILKFIGLGAIGIGGVGTAIVFGSDKVSKFVGLSSSSPTSSTSISLVSSNNGVVLSEEDKQYQFMYELSKKLFESLSKLSDFGASEKENVIEWLRDQFSVSLEDKEDKWENFKSLCENQKAKEKSEGDNVDNQYSRLCFVDIGENPKGNLFNKYLESLGQFISHSYPLVFDGFSKKNVDLWNEFKSKYPSSNPSSEFGRWYDESEIGTYESSTSTIKANTGIGLFKGVISHILEHYQASTSY